MPPFEPGANPVRLTVQVDPTSTGLGEDGLLALQYRAWAVAGAPAPVARFEWLGGVRLLWAQAPAQTNQAIVTAAETALHELTGHVWRPGIDQTQLIGGRTG